MKLVHNRINQNRTGQNKPDQNNQNRPEKTRTDQNRPEQTRADQNRPEQTRTEQNRAEQTRTDQNRPEQTRTDQNRPDQTRIDQNRPYHFSQERIQFLTTLVHQQHLQALIQPTVFASLFWRNPSSPCPRHKLGRKFENIDLQLRKYLEKLHL